MNKTRKSDTNFPSNWNMGPLSTLLEESDMRVSEIGTNEEIEIFSLTKNHGLIPQSERFGKRIATEDISKYKVIEHGWIAYNPYVIWEGAVHALRTKQRGAVSPVYRIWKRKESDNGFVDFLLRTPLLIDAYNKFSAGAVNRRRSIKRGDFLAIQVPTPPINEQRQIAHTLNTVRESTENTAKAITASQQFKQSLIHHLFTYGPLPVDNAAYVDLRETAAGLHPADWSIVTLETVCKRRTSTVDPKKNRNLPYVGLEHIDSGEMLLTRWGNATEVRSTKTLFSKGDILFGKLRPYLDKVAIAPFDGMCSTDIIALSPNLSTANSTFLAALLHTKRVLDHAIATTTGVNHPRTSWNKMMELVIALPPEKDRNVIGEIISAVENKIAAEQKYHASSISLFNTLIRDLMTGKVRVNPDKIKV